MHQQPSPKRYRAPNKRHNQEENDKPRSLLECAELVLPWLTPSELANISLTCKSLHRISKSITALRSSDASRAFENLPIPFLNSVDTQPYAFFLYTPSQIPSSSSFVSPQRQPWGWSSSHDVQPNCGVETVRLTDGSAENAWGGCACGDCCVDNECPCSRFDGLEDVVVRECGPSCGCGSECGNRSTQRGVSVKLKIVRDSNKGWSLCADDFIPTGRFVCELLTTNEARRRQQKYDDLALGGCFSSALLVVREHLPSRKACLRLNIDATRVGNVARFINHSCDGGNLSTVLVRSSGALLPRLCFFASKDIKEGEELTFSYGGVRLRSKGSRCCCGSSSCFGWLPSEQT
ncbi:histone-lysine N-methyltransferase SUVR3 isoform X2 [Morus notabilis]|uniref:histone-lysine N-methyltransferase SUVR3 isoform X2 n=1 Tax=Morus notabilis TaxID=981085 RepID=UPI000CED7710|nr:histone-lysine N-methyltransferase SUVR3 isoform X2 [Morus notabilis]